MRIRIALMALACAASTAVPSFAQQSEAVGNYLRGSNAAEVARKPDRTVAEIRDLLPQNRSAAFADYIRSRFAREFTQAALRQAVESQRLNKLVGNTPTGAGTTSILSRVAAPGSFGFASEFGTITQNTNGNTTTLRGNLLGIVNLVAGDDQFPSCPDVTSTDCSPASKWLRRISGSASFDSLTSADESSESSPVFSDLFGENFRLSNWTVRLEWTKNDPDDPKYLEAWRKAVTGLRGPQAEAFTAAIRAVFTSEGLMSQAYVTWLAQAVPALQAVPAAAFDGEIEKQLDALVLKMSAAEPAFWDRVVALRRTREEFFAARNEVLKAIQSHQFSMEYASAKPADQPELSTLRLIYSHQPSASRPVLLTVNAGVRWYTRELAVFDATGTPKTDQSRLRDVQFGAQLDRRFGPELRESVLTLAGYYQWMADDALLKFDPDSLLLPGSGITLSKTAMALFDTKGKIYVLQGKLTIPLNGSTKLPLSLTRSNKRELITELEKKPVWKLQMGFTFDFDGLIKGNK